MVRTNVVIDEKLIRRVMDIYQLRSKREAIDFALRYAARTDERREKALKLEGAGWPGDLNEIRGGGSEVISP
jgi:Arc/MetJ family transcription regulator